MPAPDPIGDTIVAGALNPVEGKIVSVPNHAAINEKASFDDTAAGKELEAEIQAVAPQSESDSHGKDNGSEEVIIRTGADAAQHLLPLRDDFQPSLTFRSIFLATCLSAFQAVMSQIYTFKPTQVTISGTFIVLIAYFMGKAWANFLPRGDKLEARWREKGGEGTPPRWIRTVSFLNRGPWNLKEHAICAITATSASNAAASITVFAAQDLFYDLPLSPATVVLSVISIGLFGYGICGIMRPIAVWHVDAVYWSTLPTITSFNTSLPLALQAHAALGYFVCFIVMLGIYYSNAWDAKSQPFMSTRLRSEDGSTYPIAKVFTGGVLNKEALATYGIPRLTGSFAYAMFMANAAIGALIAHCFLFWGGDVVNAYKSARSGRYDDRHHAHMAKHYKETPWWWYVVVLVLSFILGIVVVTTQNITLPAWAYIVALLLGIFIAPLSTILYSRYGNGIATNNLSKMLAGLLLPERPIGNMYFAAWSHNVISNAVTLSNDLKMGEYLKIPPRVMFLTQVYGTILGGFINYAVMISIVNGNRELLVDSDGNNAWSGATMQSYNTNATSWALAHYLYKIGGKYEMVPIGLGIGFGIVAFHRLVVHTVLTSQPTHQFVPKIRGFSLSEINFPQFIQYAGFIPYNQSQTCVIFSQIIAGFFTQFYLRNYRPRIFRDYSYLVTGAMDGASLTVLFILSFAVFGAGGSSKPFPTWWGNNADGYYDLCPSSE
ncbi:oligopeptide transporter 7 [Colletotrichum sp. SAR11_59]|nr:oligopeptide transporter 7 [Colletotrichum sp. SAR11_59]